MPSPVSSFGVPKVIDHCDIAGWVKLKTRVFGVAKLRHLRLKGSVLTVHLGEETTDICTTIHLQQSHVTLLKHHLRGCTIRVVSQGAEKLLLTAGRREVAQKWLSALTIASQRRFEDYYSCVSKLGTGSFAQVFKAKACDGREYAVKRIRPDPENTQAELEIDREICALKRVHHDGIVQIHDVFRNEFHVDIILDLARGGSLRDVLDTGMMGSVSEKCASSIIRQVLSACAHMHARGIVHRDIKLENVLCDTKDLSTARIFKLTDFGLSNFVEADGPPRLHSVVGTPGYVAPELLAEDGAYGVTVDMYSVGVMAYRLVSGSHPFPTWSTLPRASTNLSNELMNQFVADGPNFEGARWDRITPLCKSFILALMQLSPSRRLTAASALHHPWLQSFRCDSTDGIRHISENYADINNGTAPGTLTPRHLSALYKSGTRNAFCEQDSSVLTQMFSRLTPVMLSNVDGLGRQNGVTAGQHVSQLMPSRSLSNMLQIDMARRKLCVAIRAVRTMIRMHRAAGVRFDAYLRITITKTPSQIEPISEHAEIAPKDLPSHFSGSLSYSGIGSEDSDSLWQELDV